MKATRGRTAKMAATVCARLRHRIAGQDPISLGAPWAWLSVIAFALALAALVNAMLGPPIVFSDEFTYYTAASQIGGRVAVDTAIRAQDLPNRLFLALYGLAGTSLSPFALARTLNVIALGAGLIALFVAASATNARGKGLAVAVAYGIGALSTYTSYFMPDALYGGMYLVTFVALTVALTTASAVAGALAGVACAALTFVKPHGWVTAGVFGMFTLFHVARAVTGERPDARRVGVAMLAAFALCWVVLHVALPDVVERRALLGEMYGGVVSWVVTAASDVKTYGSIAKLFAVDFVLLAALAAPALLFAGWAALRPRASVQASPDGVACVFAEASFAILLALTAMTAVFTVSAVGMGPYEVANRLHWRYFNFALPLLVLGTAASATADAFFRRNFGIVVAMWAAACIGAAFLLPHYVWSFADSPELFFGWNAPKAAYAGFGAAGVLGCLVFRRVPGVVVRSMLLAYTLDALVGGASVRQVQLSIGELPENRAGRFASAMADETRRPMLLLGEGTSIGLYRVASYLPLSARFVTPAEFARAARSPAMAGAVVVGERDNVLRTGIAPIAEFGPWSVAIVAPERVTAPSR